MSGDLAPELVMLLKAYEDSGEVPDGDELAAAVKCWLDAIIEHERKRHPNGKPAVLTTGCGCQRIVMVPVPAPAVYGLPVMAGVSVTSAGIPPANRGDLVREFELTHDHREAGYVEYRERGT